jgi:hypothetical protein
MSFFARLAGGNKKAWQAPSTDDTRQQAASAPGHVPQPAGLPLQGGVPPPSGVQPTIGQQPDGAVPPPSGPPLGYGMPHQGGAPSPDAEQWRYGVPPPEGSQTQGGAPPPGRSPYASPVPQAETMGHNLAIGSGLGSSPIAPPIPGPPLNVRGDTEQGPHPSSLVPQNSLQHFAPPVFVGDTMQPQLSHGHSMPHDVSAALSTRSSSGDIGRKSGGKDMLHKVKLRVKGGPASKVIKSDDSLGMANEALQAYSRSLTDISDVINMNDSGYRMLAESQRRFVSTVSSVFVDTDPALTVTNEVHAPADTVKAITVPKSTADVLRKEIQTAMSDLQARVNKLAELHKFRENQTKEHVYFTSKFTSLETNAMKKAGGGTAVNDKETEKLSRNKTKLTEVTTVLNSVTDQFYNELEIMYKDRALFVDKFVRYFILVQSELLVPFAKLPNTMSLHGIGVRAMPGGCEPPKRPQPAAVHVSFSPTDNPQLVSNVGYPEGGVTYPGHPGNTAMIPPVEIRQPGQVYYPPPEAHGRSIYPPPEGRGTEYHASNMSSYNTQVNHAVPQTPSLSTDVVPGAELPPVASTGVEHLVPAAPISASVWGVYAEGPGFPGSIPSEPASNAMEPLMEPADFNVAPPAPSAPAPISDIYVPVPPPQPSYVRNG